MRRYCWLLFAIFLVASCQAKEEILMVPLDGSGPQWVNVRSDAQLLARHIDREARWIVAQAVQRAKCISDAVEQSPKVVVRYIEKPAIKQAVEPSKNKPISNRINPNTASLSRLEQLPGVGPVTAHAIIVARPYIAVQDLLHVQGIGPKTLAKIRPMIRITGTP